jgi:hypothetical protein
MASVLLLFYHLLLNGGFSIHITHCIDQEDFDAFDYLNVEVVEEAHQDVDQDLLREGAAIFLICELNDVVEDLEKDYLDHPYTKKVVQALSRNAASVIPQTTKLLELVRAGKIGAEWEKVLDEVFTDCVVRRFASLLRAQAR